MHDGIRQSDAGIAWEIRKEIENGRATAMEVDGEESEEEQGDEEEEEEEEEESAAKVSWCPILFLCWNF